MFMGRLKSLLTIVALTVGLVLGSISPIGGEEFDTQTKYMMVKRFVQDDYLNDFLIYDKYNSMTGHSYKFYVGKENTADHNYFDWTWTVHLLTWTYPGVNDKTPGWFQLEAKDYQEFVTADSRGVLVTKIVDKNMDGVVDEYRRDYYVVMQGNTIMMPDYPKGYVNPDWNTLTEAEQNRFLQRELNFWIKVAGKEA